MKLLTRDRGGYALLIALVALGGMGAVVSTGFALARSESRTGLSALARVQAQSAAETAAADALLGWNRADTPTQPGQEFRIVQVNLPGAVEGAATVRSLGGPVFAIRATGIRREAGGGAIGFAEIEVLVLLDSTPEGRIRPRTYPRGWRILP
jgi:hypothetical protein